jgi:hypothetical protein
MTSDNILLRICSNVSVKDAINALHKVVNRINNPTIGDKPIWLQSSKDGVRIDYSVLLNEESLSYEILIQKDNDSNREYFTRII